MASIQAREVHVMIGCADARDLGPAHIEALEATTGAYRDRGIDVELHVIRTAGSFVTPDVVSDLKTIFEEAQREVGPEEAPLRFFVHLTTHGQLTKESDRSYCGHVYRMAIVDGSPLNCGMMGASKLGIELEQLLLERRPEIAWAGKRFRIETENDIRTMLSRVYAHEGYLAGDWLRGIDTLRTHPRTQKAVLEQAIALDPELSSLDITVTAGIQDYSIHALVRVDGGEPAAAFWDEMQQRIREANQGAYAERVQAQSGTQHPMAGLLCLTDPRQSSRGDAAGYYLRLKGIDADVRYSPNVIFNIAGRGFDVPYSPFGPYAIGGFYYGVKYLGLREWMVLGKDAEETRRMMAKLRRDPLMRLIIETFHVILLPLNQQELAAL